MLIIHNIVNWFSFSFWFVVCLFLQLYYIHEGSCFVGTQSTVFVGELICLFSLLFAFHRGLWSFFIGLAR